MLLPSSSLFAYQNSTNETHLREITHLCGTLIASRDRRCRALGCFPVPSVVHVAQHPSYLYLTQSLFQLKVVKAIRRSHHVIKVADARVRWQLTQAHPGNNWYLVPPHTRCKQPMGSSMAILVEVSVVVQSKHVCDTMWSRSTPFLKQGRATPCSSMKGPVPFVTGR